MILIGPKIVAASKVFLRNPMLKLFESPLRVHLCVYGNHLEWEPPKELQRSQGGEEPGYPTEIFAAQNIEEKSSEKFCNIIHKWVIQPKSSGQLNYENIRESPVIPRMLGNPELSSRPISDLHVECIISYCMNVCDICQNFEFPPLPVERPSNIMPQLIFTSNAWNDLKFHIPKWIPITYLEYT